MTLKTLASAATLLLTLSPLTLAAAQSTSDEVTIFETVDDYGTIYSDYNNRVSLTGIVRGESTPRTLEFGADYSYQNYGERLRTCERLSLISMSKPGQYLLEVRYLNDWEPKELRGCRLIRR
ncbi:hypothetical protein JQX13_21560 [Archangium violaceum]|uniref:hypothetical protein n=1 Tax=Archangium violaceum TaxID=83451 RepID=UPI00193B3EA9|nr:hypothetical protein [Archangium violaceum]QRK12381.1 hypothetical protein JQX13_21560 [Archangium violaceum]